MDNYNTLAKINKPEKFILTSLVFLNIIVTFSIIILSIIPVDSLIAKDPTGEGFFMFYKTHGYKTAFNLAWGIYGYRLIQLRYLLFLFFSVLAFSICQLTYPRVLNTIYENLQKNFRFKMKQNVRYLMYFVSILFVLILFRINPTKNYYFADGSQLPLEIRHGMIFAAEIITTAEYVILDKFISIFYETSTAFRSIGISSILNGLIFVPSVFFLAKTLSTKSKSFSLLFLGIITTVPIINFLGYMETTSLCLSMIATYILFGLKYIQNTQIKYFMLSSITLTLAILSHTGAVLLVPSFVLLYLKGNVAKPDYRVILKLAFNRTKLLIISFLILLPLLLISYNLFYAKGNLGNIQGGGDGIQFVPLSFDYANPVSQFVYYDMISLWHFIDIAWIVLLSATFLIPVSLLYLALAPKRLNKKLLEETFFAPNRLHFLLFVSAFTALVPILWNHDFGMWGDWNISATFLFPSQILTWFLTMSLLEKLKQKSKIAQLRITLIKINMILLQLLLFLGLYLQLK